MELQVPAALLATLNPAAHPRWAGLLADARRRLAGLPVDGSPDRRPAARDHAGRRRARAELDRWIRVRDRQCGAPGCRRPAVACDLDHTRDWALDGPSAAWNLGALCRRHHRMKHLGRWRLSQPAPGEFVWRTRAGVLYLVPARRVTDPLPAPVPRPDGRPRALGPAKVVPGAGGGLRPTRPDSAEPTGRVADRGLHPTFVGAPLASAQAVLRPLGRDPDDDPAPF